MEIPKVLYGKTEGLVFKEAVKYLEEKIALPAEEYKKLAEECRAKAFTVSGYESAQVLQRFLDELAEAASEGKAFEQFKEEMEGFLDRNGYSQIQPAHLVTVFRTNMQTAYNVGHYRSMANPATVKLRPYWQYVTAGDGHVRESHEAMDGRVYRADDPIWDIWYPPNGFRCRCSVVSLSPSQVRVRGLTVETQPPDLLDPETGEIRMAVPDKGFSYNPAKTSWDPDLSGLSSKVKNLVKERKP